MKKQKKLEAKVPSVPAVGVVSYSPNIFVIFGAYSSRPTEDRIFNFPRKDGKPFDLPKSETGNNYVMLLDAGRLEELRPFAARIHRLLVFGVPEEIQALGLPIIDAEVTEDGKISKKLTHRPDELRSKIEQQATGLKLQPVRAKKMVEKKADAEPSKRSSQPKLDPNSLLGRLRKLQPAFDGDKNKFEDTILIPTILRLVREMKRADFAVACAAVRKAGVDSATVKAFQAYVEEQTGSDQTVGRAARSYLWPKKGKPVLEKLAERYQCNLPDLRFVVLGVQRLQNLTT